MRAWLFRYGVAFVLALVLTGILSHSPLFATTPLAPGGLTAAHLVRLIGSLIVLTLLWRAAVRASAALPEDGGWRSLLRHTMIPLATLIILAIGYHVLLIVLRPYLTGPAIVAYEWVFVLAIMAAAVWFALVAYQNADALTSVLPRLVRAMTDARSSARTAAPAPTLAHRRCAKCGHDLPDDSESCRFCDAAAA